MDTIRHTTRSSPAGPQPGQARLLLYGDSLDSLAYLAAAAPHSHGALDDRRARTMIVGIRVPDTNHPRQALRSQLRAAHDILTKPLRTHPLVRHIFYIVEVPSDSPTPDRAVNALSAAICAHHAEIEMRHGRDICITGIVTTCRTDPEALAERVDQRVTTTPLESHYATSWDQIAHRSIAAAAAEALL
ncbi:hypothetical protein G9U51_06495 [Calidifontibacter sp. DB0510]|uniref:Uncharacterized protein n=2 Tax=Micrococcales TaxID=85006 RepID=A0A967AYL1_9MICO|nr:MULTISPECIES: hypothetical protein [Micrococcales]MBM7827975.1 hypothetical protein [Microbacterium aurum]NHN55431.1 hypothetical protein [Metallococcus carri]NOP36509.1 hypothetical protein [Calidifontibacter sp. DB2511S]